MGTQSPRCPCRRTAVSVWTLRAADRLARPQRGPCGRPDRRRRDGPGTRVRRPRTSQKPALKTDGQVQGPSIWLPACRGDSELSAGGPTWGPGSSAGGAPVGPGADRWKATRRRRDGPVAQGCWDGRGSRVLAPPPCTEVGAGACCAPRVGENSRRGFAAWVGRLLSCSTEAVAPRSAISRRCHRVVGARGQLKQRGRVTGGRRSLRSTSEGGPEPGRGSRASLRAQREASGFGQTRSRPRRTVNSRRETQTQTTVRPPHVPCRQGDRSAADSPGGSRRPLPVRP